MAIPRSRVAVLQRNLYLEISATNVESHFDGLHAVLLLYVDFHPPGPERGPFLLHLIAFKSIIRSKTCPTFMILKDAKMVHGLWQVISCIDLL